MAVLRVRFGNKLKHLRKKADLTQQQLAEKTGLSIDFIGMIERGERAPSFDTLEKFSEALNIKIADLFTEEKEGVIK